MINPYLLWIAIAAGIAAILSRDGLKKDPDAARGAPIPRAATIALAAFALAALLAGLKWQKEATTVLPIAYGFVGGAALSWLAEFVGRSAFARGSVLAGPLGFAVAVRGLMLLPFVSRAVNVHEAGLAAGFALGTWMLSLGSGGGGWAARTTAFLMAILLTDQLGSMNAGGNSTYAGLVFGIGFCVFAASVTSLGKLLIPDSRSGREWISGGALLVLTILGAYLIGTRHLWLAATWQVFTMSALVAVAVHWFLPREQTQSRLPLLLGAVIWLGVATLAFGMLRGYGMAIALLAATGILLFFNNPRALATLAPLAAITVYRIFYEGFGRASRGLDIGQHYELVGFLAGLALVALAIEFRLRRKENAAAAAMSFLLMLALPALTAVLIGSLGYVGLLVGMGFGFLMLDPGSLGSFSLGIQAALALLYARTFGWFDALINLTREEKVGVLKYAVPIVGLIVVAIVALSRPSVEVMEEAQVS